MSRRIDIELTSTLDDGTWTWRAAGAKQPKGVVEASVVPEGTTVGTILRAEVDQGIEGIEVLSLQAPKVPGALKPRPGLIEVIGTPKKGPDVSVTLVPGKKRRDRDGEPTAVETVDVDAKAHATVDARRDQVVQGARVDRADPADRVVRALRARDARTVRREAVRRWSVAATIAPESQAGGFHGPSQRHAG